MIRLTDTPVIRGESEAAVKIGGLYRAYGGHSRFLRFYQGDGGSAISLMDGQAVLLAGDDAEEAGLFLQMQPEVRGVRTDGETARMLSLLWPGDYRFGEVMTLSGPILPLLQETVPLTPCDIHPVLLAGFGADAPPFDSFYVDVSHRMRHGCCRAAGVMADDTVAATAMTTAETETAAVIGAVATLPAYRGRGYASACVTALAAALKREGKRVLLSPKNEAAGRLYRQLGFTPCGEWGEICVHTAQSL